jgi:hypothetical protein
MNTPKLEEKLNKNKENIFNDFNNSDSIENNLANNNDISTIDINQNKNKLYHQQNYKLDPQINNFNLVVNSNELKNEDNSDILDLWTTNIITFEEFQRKMDRKKKNIIKGIYEKIDNTDTKMKNKK